MVRGPECALDAEPLFKGFGQRAALRLSEGRRQNDRRAAERRVELQQGLDLAAHVGVVGVCFVDHQHAVAEPPQARDWWRDGSTPRIAWSIVPTPTCARKALRRSSAIQAAQ